MFSLDRPLPETRLFHDYVASLPRLDGRTVAITGCTSGTGKVLAATCANLGARVVLLNRASERARKVESELVSAGGDVHGVACDLQSFAGVRAAGAELRERFDAIDVLVNNAGVMAIDDLATEDGCDVQMQTNHLSHFLLTSEVWPLLTAAADARGEARIVNHSSAARLGAPLKPRYLGKHGGDLGGDGWPGLDRWRRYRQSKLANLLFTYALHEHIVAEQPAYADKIKVLCAHPGPADSGLQGKTPSRRWLDRYILWRTLKAAQSVEDGTLGICRAACAPEVTSTDFYGPTREARTGEAVRLPPERDPEGESALWDESLKTTGITAYFGL
ncbi:MAG: SDR family NAD(P)-dependent oxidoreductase [Deltaproteobacteria bacterium]|nr:MAG: SDR family NAD(P)-dependent oxidoreductase [Deltaproteobacteria bacterium]